jgi:hypothetical protein
MPFTLNQEQRSFNHAITTPESTTIRSDAATVTRPTWASSST